MQTALYIGCGTDVAPILALQQPPFNVTRFVLVDSQPLTEFGDIKGPGLERPFFIQNFRSAMMRIGYSFSRKCKDNNFLFVNRKLSTTVSLWYNQAFPFCTAPSKLVHEMASAETLIVCGHNPHKSILNFMKCPRLFVSDSKTVLCDDENEVDPFGFCSWLLLRLPPLWWCREWLEDERPQAKLCFTAEEILRRQKDGCRKLQGTSS